MSARSSRYPSAYPSRNPSTHSLARTLTDVNECGGEKKEGDGHDVQTTTLEVGLREPQLVRDPRLESDAQTISGDSAKEEQEPSKEEQTQPVDAVPPHGRLIPLKQFLIVYACLALAVLLTSLDQTIVACLTPVISSEFGAAKQISWVGTAFLLSSTSCSPLYGRLSDVFGRKSAFLAAQLIFLGGTALCGAAPSMMALIFGRAIAGIGGGGLFSMVHICVSDVVNLRHRGKYHGILGAINGAGSIIGPVVGGVFGQKVSWRWAFYFQLPIIAVCMVSTIFFLPTIGTRKKDLMWEKIRSVDYLGILTLVSGCVLVMLALNMLAPPRRPFTSPIVSGFFFGGIALLFLFVLVEWKVAKMPVMPLAIFRNIPVVIVFVLNGTFGYFFYASIYFLPIFFQIASAQGVVESSLSLMPVVLSSIVLSWFSGLVTSWTGNYSFSLIIASVFQVIGASLIYTMQQSTPTWTEIIFMLITGIGFGCQMQNSLVAAQSATHKSQVAMTTAVRNFFRNIGGVVGLAISNMLLNLLLSRKLDSALGSKFSDDLLDTVQDSPLEVYHLPPNFSHADQQLIIDAYVQSLRVIFLIFIPIAALGLVCAIILPEFELDRAEDGAPVRKPSRIVKLIRLYNKRLLDSRLPDARLA